MNEVPDEKVKWALIELGEDFVEEVLNCACKLAKNWNTYVGLDDEKQRDWLIEEDINTAVMLLYGTPTEPYQTFGDL